DIFDPERDMILIEKLINLDSSKYLLPHHNINPSSGSTTSSSPNHLLEEFTDELALITFPPGNDDLPFEIKSDLKEIEYLLNHDAIKEIDSILRDLVDEDNLINLNDNLVDTMPEMFTDKHALDYSSPPLYDAYDDDIFEDFDPPLYELPFHKEVPDAETLLLFSFENEEKVFKPKILASKGVHSSLLSILSHRGPKAFKVNKILESLMEIFPCSYGEDILILDVPYKNVKKIAISHASLILEDFDPPLYELPFHKEVP
nr:hypothetical protein [Tanacetum cinerariifolium]